MLGQHGISCLPQQRCRAQSRSAGSCLVWLTERQEPWAKCSACSFLPSQTLIPSSCPSCSPNPETTGMD